MKAFIVVLIGRVSIDTFNEYLKHMFLLQVFITSELVNTPFIEGLGIRLKGHFLTLRLQFM